MAKNKKNSSNVPLQSKLFLLELYTEWNDFNKIIDKIKLHCTYYAYIIHDKDINNDTGEVKKSHCHLICEFSKKRTCKGVHNLINSLSLELRFIDIVTNENSMTRYFLHLDDKDKYQYQDFEIISNDYDRVSRNLLLSIPKNIQANLLFDYIDSYPEKLTTYKLRKYAFENNLIEGFNAFYSQLRDYKQEHNALYLLVDSDDYKRIYERQQKDLFNIVNNQNILMKSLASIIGVGTYVDDDGQEYVIAKGKKHKK